MLKKKRKQKRKQQLTVLPAVPRGLKFPSELLLLFFSQLSLSDLLYMLISFLLLIPEGWDFVILNTLCPHTIVSICVCVGECHREREREREELSSYLRYLTAERVWISFSAN